MTQLPFYSSNETSSHATCLSCLGLSWAPRISPWLTQPTGVCWFPEPWHDKTLPTREADRGQGSEIEKKSSPKARPWSGARSPFRHMLAQATGDSSQEGQHEQATSRNLFRLTDPTGPSSQHNGVLQEDRFKARFIPALLGAHVGVILGGLGRLCGESPQGGPPPENGQGRSIMMTTERRVLASPPAEPGPRAPPSHGMGDCGGLLPFPAVFPTVTSSLQVSAQGPWAIFFLPSQKCLGRGKKKSFYSGRNKHF